MSEKVYAIEGGRPIQGTIAIGGAKNAISKQLIASLLTDRTARRFLIGARVKRGISSSQAAAEVDAIGRTLEPDSRAASDSPGLRLESLSPVPGSGGPAVAMLAPSEATRAITNQNQAAAE